MHTDLFGFDKGHSVYILRVRIAISIILFLVLISILLYDTFQVNSFISQKTKKFAQDLTFQQASNISREFSVRVLNMRMIADSLVEESKLNNDFQLSTFLRRKMELSLFNDLFFVDINAIPYTDNFSPIHINGCEINLNRSHILHSSKETNHTCIHYTEQYPNNDDIKLSYIYYIQQVIQDGNVIGVLVGIRFGDTLQDFIQLKALNNETVSCIVDKNTKIVVSPTNKHLPNHRSFDDFVLFEETEENRNALQEIRNNIKKAQQGIQTVTSSVDGRKLLIAYNPLEINDWGLLSIIPEDVISFDSASYSIRNLLISVIAIFIFSFITISSTYTFIKDKQKMEKLAFYDPITDGLNKEGFALRFKEVVETHKANQYAVVFINVRHFKLINEQFGKENGYRLLKHIIYTMGKCLNSNEFVARYSGDMFLICLKEQDPQIIEARLHHIVVEINSFNMTLPTPYYIEVNCGVRMVENHQHELTLIQDHAQLACEIAEKDNLFCVFYEATYTDKLLRNQELDSLFESSIENGYFELYLQPKVSLKTGEVCGAEALVRWQHPQKGKIFPSDFIPIFESNGKICELDLYMFTAVCKTLRRWRLEGRRLFPISFNLSRQHYFQNPEFLEVFVQIAKNYQISPGLLDFELTESMFFESDKLSVIKESLDEMHQLGFLCSLDDFGTGFSSLGLLKEFNIDTIKFDKQFFLDISTDKSKTIIESLMSMSEKLRVKTVAEGIETHEQLVFLNGIPCDAIQGYIFSMPLAVDEFEEWLDSLENNTPPPYI